ISKKLGFMHLDTGAMYRAVTLGLKKTDVSLEDEVNIQKLLVQADISFSDENRIFLNGADVSREIRSADISSRVSAVSALPIIRDAMVRIQRKIAENTDCVLEGRDIGTIVFPNADFKFFLIADMEVRAKRRLLELEAMGETTTLSELINDIEKRDRLDSSRDHSPLIQAEDAILIDTSGITIDDQINKIVKIITKGKVKEK
ncbi:MAG: (d)CMP kinase, partial [Candidatus Neomarinimicrobiota bacterium]|nr:(d)CMP kinase [Candidatus Neomarinimicrobiota bacterium]